MRLPLQNTLRPRLGDSDKDQVTVNGFIEAHKSGTRHTVKRPGLVVQAEGAGTANGAFYYEGEVFVWDDTTDNTDPLRLNVFPPYGVSQYEYWSALTSYTTISDPVAYPDSEGVLKTWYPQQASTGETPEEGVYWSETPLDSTFFASFDASNFAYPVVNFTNNETNIVWDVLTENSETTITFQFLYRRTTSNFRELKAFIGGVEKTVTDTNGFGPNAVSTSSFVVEIDDVNPHIHRYRLQDAPDQTYFYEVDWGEEIGFPSGYTITSSEGTPGTINNVVLGP